MTNRVEEHVQAKMRQFTSGATRHTDEGKLDFEGFIHPTVLRLFAEYMNENRIQADGETRASDNWQKGIPPQAYAKSLIRHVMDVWEQWRVHPPETSMSAEEFKRMKDSLCAVMFNSMGLLFEMDRRETLVLS